MRGLSMLSAVQSTRPFHIFPTSIKRHVVHVPDLEQLPDHECLEDRPDAAGHDHERVGRDNEMLQAQERAVLEGVLDEGIHVLLERQLHTDADRASFEAGPEGPAPSLAACTSPGPPPVTMSQPMAVQRRGRSLLDFFVDGRPGLGAGGPEDGDTVSIPPRRDGGGSAY